MRIKINSIFRRLVSTKPIETNRPMTVGKKLEWDDYYIYIMAPITVVFYFYCLIKEGEHVKHLSYRKKYEHEYRVHRPLPWGDGQTPLFGLPYGKTYEDYKGE